MSKMCSNIVEHEYQAHFISGKYSKANSGRDGTNFNFSNATCTSNGRAYDLAEYKSFSSKMQFGQSVLEAYVKCNSDTTGIQEVGFDALMFHVLD